LDNLQGKRAAILYNPVARGLVHREHSLQRSVQTLASRGIEARLIATTGPGSAGAQALHQIEAGCDLIVAAGGDGTINEVANGMLHSSVPLAILPGGTANVLAREMRVPLRLERAAAQIPEFLPVRIAAGALRMPGSPPRLFLCMAGAGLDAEIVSRLNLDLKAAAGKLAYYVCGFTQVIRPLREFEVVVDGKRFEASFALVSRVRNYGGDLEIARGASLLHGDFEVVLFRGTQSVHYLRYLAGVLLRRAHRLRGCTIVRGRSIVCQAGEPPPGSLNQNIYIQVDGELAGKLPMTVEIVPEALTLLAPPEYLARERQLVALPACA
jgi:YegS/Rv2252/BmrU family lipid kinase